MVRLIDGSGKNLGIMKFKDALALAQEAGLDLVEISSGTSSTQAKPALNGVVETTTQIPVAKIMDYGKYRYDRQKKQQEARKRQKYSDVKEIKLRPTIETHDYEVKMRAVRRFLEAGDKVKITLRYRGREMSHMEIGEQLLHRVLDEVKNLARIESAPKLEGRQIVTIISPAPSAHASSSTQASPSAHDSTSRA